MSALLGTITAVLIGDELLGVLVVVDGPCEPFIGWLVFEDDDEEEE